MRCRAEYTQKTNLHRTRLNVTAFNASLELGRLRARHYSSNANEMQKHTRKEKCENERIAQKSEYSLFKVRDRLSVQKAAALFPID